MEIPKDMQSVEVDTAMIQTFHRVLGSFVMSLLNDETIVSGSVVLDVIHGTNHANDIDVFTKYPDEISEKARQRGCIVRTCDQREEYGKTFERYLVLDREEGKIRKIDIIQGVPLKEVSEFDLAPCRVAFDGRRLWTSTNNVSDVPYALWEMARYRGTYAGLYDKYRMRLIRRGIRVRKYILRGYTLVDEEGWPAIFTKDELDAIGTWKGAALTYTE